MTVKATYSDLKAYQSIGGAIDKFSGGWTFIKEGLKIVGDNYYFNARYDSFVKNSGKVQKIWDYGVYVKDMFDENKRDGTMLKLGLKIATDLGTKLLGRSVTAHPYYALHKAAIEALADTLNASRNAQSAIDAYRKAVSAANSEAIKKAFTAIDDRKVTISAGRSRLPAELGDALTVVREQGSPEFLRKKVEKIGADKLTSALIAFEEWRAAWAGLAFETVELAILTGHQVVAAHEAMDHCKKLIAEMIKGNSVHRVFGYGAQNTINWDIYDAEIGAKKNPAAVDPVAFAIANRDKAQSWATEMCAMSDFARTINAYYSSDYNRQLEKLNKVLYPG